MWGFFLNSSRILKDFRKIQYAMPCNGSYATLFLERFYMHGKFDMQPICTSMLAKFILAQSRCYQPTPPPSPLKGISPSRIWKHSGIISDNLL
jgi:hypothetical protein